METASGRNEVRAWLGGKVLLVSCSGGCWKDLWSLDACIWCMVLTQRAPNRQEDGTVRGRSEHVLTERVSECREGGGITHTEYLNYTAETNALLS